MAEDNTLNQSLGTVEPKGDSISDKGNNESQNDKPKAQPSKKFHQETFKSTRGNEYVMTFPGMRKAMKLQSGADGLKGKHQMYMKDILEGKYDYSTFDNIKDDVNRQDTVDVTEEDGSTKTYHLSFDSIENVDDLTTNAMDISGNFDEYNAQEYVLSNIVKEDVDLDYFDTHNGYADIIQHAINLYYALLHESEFAEVIQATNDFVEKMFR
jgi:hypothetical protein